jgi:hypothetical protein
MYSRRPPGFWLRKKTRGGYHVAPLLLSDGGQPAGPPPAATGKAAKNAIARVANWVVPLIND